MDDLSKKQDQMSVLVRERGDDFAEGTFIPPEVIEKCVQCSHLHRDYSLKCLQFKRSFEAYLENVKGMRVITRQHKGGIRILPNREAARYIHERVNGGFADAHRCHLRAEVCIDVYALPTAERERFEAQQRANARKLLFLADNDFRERQNGSGDGEE